MKIKQDLTLKDFTKMEEIERQYYREEYITPAQESYECYCHYADAILVAEKDEEIIGFMNLFPISFELFQEIEAGVFNDSQLTSKDIVESDYLFLSCVVVAPAFRGRGVANFLLKSYLKRYEQKKEIIMDTVTEDGSQFAHKYGFKLVGSSMHQSKVYKIAFQELKKRASEN